MNRTSPPEVDAIELAAVALERQAEALRAQATALRALRKQEREAAATPPALACLVDKSTLATAIGVSIPTVDRLCRAGTIPWTAVGDVRRFDVAKVREALDQSTANKQRAKAVKPASFAEADDAPSGVRSLSRARRAS